MFLFIVVFLGSLGRFSWSSSFFSSSSPSSGHEILHRKLADNAICPLNLTKLDQLATNHPSQLRFQDVQSECHALQEGIRMARSDYLRSTGYFTFPPDESESCWIIYQSIISKYIPSFDLKSNCRFQNKWISSSCKNISTKQEFESLVPESQLQELNHLCNQSLYDNSSCVPCVASLSNIEAAYFGSSESGTVSDCKGYPFMYAAAFANHLGPTDLGTAKCLFSTTLGLSRTYTQHKIGIQGVIIGCVLGFLVIITAIWLVWRQQNMKWNRKEHLCIVLEARASGFELLDKSTTLIKFDIDELRQATRNFSSQNLIGKGGYGNVFRGVLASGSEVALKRFKNCSAAGDANFTHEVEVIASIRHVNVLALRGYCTATTPLEGHQRIIVCDLLRNGSLSDHLFGPRVKRLTWPIRRKIALGIARGLAYLHNGVQPAIIHRDVKANNILLDESFEPKLADFGLAKFTPDGLSHFSTRAAGTLGYVSPEYALYGQLTEKSDVYGFGVVLLELLSGRKAAITDGTDQILLLTDWSWSLVREGRALDVIEECIPELGPSEEMEKYVLAAVLSVHPSLYARPTMERIVYILETGIGSAPSTLDPPFPTAAEIIDIQRSATFNLRSTSLTSIDQHPHQTNYSVSDGRKSEENES